MPSPLDFHLDPPGSKSDAARALVLSALAGSSTISGLPGGTDTRAMVTALRVLGTDITTEGGVTHIASPLDASGVSAPRNGEVPLVPCSIAGTVMRFLPAVATTMGISARFDLGAPNRPLRPLLDTLTQMGATCSLQGSKLLVRAPVRPATRIVSIDASQSSQFLSAMLLAAAANPPLTVQCGSYPSAPHVRMTIDYLKQAGLQVRQCKGRFEVSGTLRPRNWYLPPDTSAAAPFLLAPLITGGSVSVPWPANCHQPGHSALPTFVSALGANVTHAAGTLTISASPRPPSASTDRPLHFDVRDCGELLPALSAVLATRPGQATVTGVAHLRGHECDRPWAISGNLRALGADVRDEGEQLTFHAPAHRGGTFPTHGDHRIAMMGALIGLALPIKLDDPSVVDKTYPDFFKDWQRMKRSTHGQA